MKKSKHKVMKNVHNSLGTTTNRHNTNTDMQIDQQRDAKITTKTCQKSKLTHRRIHKKIHSDPGARNENVYKESYQHHRSQKKMTKQRPNSAS